MRKIMAFRDWDFGVLIQLVKQIARLALLFGLALVSAIAFSGCDLSQFTTAAAKDTSRIVF